MNGKEQSNLSKAQQQHHQQHTRAMQREPTSATRTQQPGQEADRADHDVHNDSEDDGSANDDAREPRNEDGASSPAQRRSTRNGLVGEQSSQEETVNPIMGRGHTRRKQRELFTGMVRDTPQPTIQHMSPPTGPRKRKWEGTYMTPHKARRGILRYAISVGPQLVERIRTSDDQDQQ